MGNSPSSPEEKLNLKENRNWISRREVREWLWEHRHAIHDTELQSLMNDLDENHDGYVTAEEYNTFLVRHDSNQTYRAVINDLIRQPSTYSVIETHDMIDIYSRF